MLSLQVQTDNAQVQRRQDSEIPGAEAPAPASAFAVETHARAKDWFEFILDLSLLERHLSQRQVEPSGSTLIVQFLYHANMTEQIYNNSALIKNGTAQPAIATANTASSPSTPSSPFVNGSDVVVLSSTPPNPAPTNPNLVNVSAIELKIKRIRLLRTLSLKTAALLDWDLIKFENE